MDIFECLKNHGYEIKELLNSGAYGDCWFVRESSVSKILKVYKSGSPDECIHEENVYKDLHGESLGMDWLFKAERVSFDKFSVLKLDTYEGCTLQQKLFSSEPELTLAEKLQLLIDACKTVAQMHNSKKPYIHLDIKPSNFYVSQTGWVKPIDLGSAVALKKAVQKDSEKDYINLINELGYMSTKEYASKLVREFNRQRSKLKACAAVTDDKKQQLLDMADRIGIKDDIYSLICCIFNSVTNGKETDFWLDHDSECSNIPELLGEILRENNVPGYLIPDFEKLFMELDGPNQYYDKQVSINSVEELIAILEDILNTEKSKGMSIGVLRRTSKEYFDEHFPDIEIDEDLLTGIEAVNS